MEGLRRLIRARDVHIALTLFFGMAAAGMVYVASWGSTPHFFQELFGPAAMFACGRGFVNPVLEQAPELDRFLHPLAEKEAPLDRCPCEALPEELATQPLDAFQQRQLYLIVAAALVWRLLGVVAWSALAPLYGVLFGAAAVALYGIFRLALPRLISACCVLLLVLSPIQLNNLVRLRDFSKAPFILAAIFILGYLIKKPFHRGRLLMLSLAAGLLLGIGCGFRMDALICVPAFMVVVLVFLDVPLLAKLGAKAVAIALFLGSFYVSSYPIFHALDTGMKYQDFLLGFNDLYDGRLGVGGAPYQIAHRYLDREPMAMLQSFALHETGETTFYEFDTEEYEAVGARYTHLILKTFPADLMIRALAAALRTVDELVPSVHHPLPRGLTNSFLRAFYLAHAHLMQFGLRYARYAVLAALLLLAARSLRLGFAALFLFFWFAGYGAIQFASRHYFHLQFVSLWAVALVLFLVARATYIAINAERRRAILSAGWAMRSLLIRCFVFVAISSALLALPLAALRAYQSGQVRRVLAAYDTAERIPLGIHTQALPDGKLLIQGEHGAGRDSLPVLPGTSYFDREFLVAEFDTRGSAVSFAALYEGTIPDLALSWAADLPATSQTPTRVYFPAYYANWKGSADGWTRYRGLVLTQEEQAKLIGLYRVSAPEQFPLLLTAIMPPDWEEMARYQSLVR